MADYEIWDARQPTRACGPYDDRGAAQEAADNINKFIYKNSAIGKTLGPLEAQVVGPYYVRPARPRTGTRGKVVVYVF